MKSFQAAALVLLISAPVMAGAQEPTPVPSATPTVSPTPGTLSASTTAVRLNPAGQTLVTVRGASGALSASLDDRIAAVTVNGATVTLVGGNRTGATTLHITDASSAKLDIPVRVAPNAFSLAQPSLTLKLTGDNLDPNFVANEVSAAVQRDVQAQPGVTPQISGITAPSLPLGPGGQLPFTVTVTAPDSDQFLGTTASLQVTAQNVAAAPFEPAILYYSDDPERINGFGLVFSGTLRAAQPVRIYDYHENWIASGARLVMAVSALNGNPTSFQIVESFHGPNIDVMSVGHAVTREFLINKPRNQGMLIDLSSTAPFIAHDVVMRFRDGVASTVDVKILSGGPLQVAIGAVDANANPANIFSLAPLPKDGKNRFGAFALANYGARAVSYTANGPDASTNLGDREPTVPPTPGETGFDYGDYGVLFTIAFNVNNPTGASQTAYLYEAPRGGPARAAYLVNGQLVELGCATSSSSPTSAPHRYQIGPAITLPPGTSQFTVMTMTDGGSNLPIEVGLTAAPPQPSPPPISSPEGCFPKPGTSP